MWLPKKYFEEPDERTDALISPEYFLSQIRSFMPRQQKQKPYLPASRTLNPAEATQRWQGAHSWEIQDAAWNDFFRKLFTQDTGQKWPWG